MSNKLNTHKIFASFFNDKKIELAAQVVSEKLAEGHTCVNIEEYNKGIDDTESDKKIDIDDLKNSSWVSSDVENIQPLFLSGNNIYLHRYYSYETEIVEQINQFIHNQTSKGFSRKELIKHKTFICKLFSDHKTKPEQTVEENINWQLTAAITSILSNFSIITGGPGTGKTTTVAKLLAIMFTLKPDLKVALAAPTGKAAARMKESLTNASDSLDAEFADKFSNLKASTLHRLLGYRFGTHYFKHNRENTLDYDVVIVDESSMIGASMMAKLLNAVKLDAKIIMLGDKDQLASVEAGSIFGDICLTQEDCTNVLTKEYASFINSFIEEENAQLSSKFITNTNISNPLQQHIIELKKSHRFKSHQGIGQFSSAVISGKIPDSLFEKPDTNSQYVLVCNDYESEELTKLLSFYKEYINEKDIATALKRINDVRILCAVRSGKYGVHHYNEIIEEYLEKEKLIAPTGSFYENQPIMITQNDKELNLFNGDVGIIRKDADGKLKAYFESAESKTGYIDIPTIYLSDYTTVFAMTIHKSQGSEFNHVGIVLPDDENQPLLTRELIYTAITRAKSSATIFTPNKVLISGTAKQVERASGITNRFVKV